MIHKLREWVVVFLGIFWDPPSQVDQFSGKVREFNPHNQLKSYEVTLQQNY
ncbi:MAG: hypothetical protein AB8G05_13675 [Oligoflexales bacterium]